MQEPLIRKLLVQVIWLFAIVLLSASVSYAEEKGQLGHIVDITVDELPFYEKTGKFLGVIKPIDPNDFIGKPVLEEAPRGLIGLDVAGEIKYFRAVNFTIGGGAAIKCPDPLQTSPGSTKRPVVRMGIGDEDCEQDES